MHELLSEQKQARVDAETRNQLRAFYDLRDTLEAGDIEKAKEWVAGAIRILENAE